MPREPQTASTARVTSALALTLLLAGLAACSGPEAARVDDSPYAGKLVLTGSSTVAPLAGEIARRFESLHPEARVDVQTGGSSRGIADARRGTADIGMASRALKQSEADLHGYTLARDGIAMIVHATNPVTALSREQIAGIYTGEVGSWSEVGGPEARITVVHKAAGRSTLELFLAHFALEGPQVRASVIIGDNEQGIKTVAGDPHAIGYVSVGAAEHSIELGVPLKLLPLGGVPAATEAVADGSYPLARPLTLMTREEPDGLARLFLDFALSPAVHDLVQDLHFVPAHERAGIRAAGGR